MKSAYIIIAVIVIAGLAYLFISNRADAPTNGVDEKPNQESSSQENEQATDESAPARSNEANEAEGEAETGSDVGMEFPRGDVEAEADASAEADAGNSVTISIDGFNFSYSQEEIRVAEGDTVTIELTSTDGFHDFVVDEFDVATERVNEGETTTVTFVADAAGTYEFYCSVGNHREQGMVGTLVVE